MQKNRDSSLVSTIPELPGFGWLAAEPEATPQTHRLRPWGFPTVSPSHPSVLPIMGYNESQWSSARSLPIGGGFARPLTGNGAAGRGLSENATAQAIVVHKRASQ